MAVFIKDTEGICSICSKKMCDTEMYSFPAFVPNLKDELSVFNDCLVHNSCLLNSGKGKKAIKLVNDFLFKIKPENRICIVDDKRIENPDDYIFIDLLSSKEDSDLYKYNFVTINRKNLKYWDEREKLIDLIFEIIKLNTWEDSSSFDYLKHLIKKLSSVQNTSD